MLGMEIDDKDIHAFLETWTRSVVFDFVVGLCQVEPAGGMLVHQAGRVFAWEVFDYLNGEEE